MDILESIISKTDILVYSLLCFLIPILLYWYSTRNYDFFKKQEIPFEKPLPFLGSFHVILQNKSTEDIEIERYKKYGRIYGVFEFSKPYISVAEPELVRNIFVKDFQYFTDRRGFPTGDSVADKMMTVLSGEDWKRVRSIVSPTFSTGKIKRVMSIFQDCAKTSIQNFKKSAAKKENVDVLEIYGAFTMDVIASSAFSTKIDSHNDPENEFVKNAKAAFLMNLGIGTLIFFMFPKLMIKLGYTFFPPENLNFFKKVTLEIIAERKRTGQTRNDFLQLLIDTAQEVEKEELLEVDAENIFANYGEASINHPVYKIASSKHLSKEELIAQCVIFFLAGYHTTASTLSLTTYLLALHENIQEKVFKEIGDILHETNGLLKYESIQKMKYLDNVISEVMRLYSPLNTLERIANVDYELGGTGFTIPKGTTVGVPICAMHRDEKFFPNPEKFDPDRFSPEEKEKHIPYSYMPFGIGPRNCVAMRFALMELKVCLVHVLSEFQAKKCPETMIPMEFKRGAAILTPVSVMLNMIPRNDCPLKL